MPVSPLLPSPSRRPGRRMVAVLAAVAVAGVLGVAGPVTGDPAPTSSSTEPAPVERAAVATSTALVASASEVETGDPVTVTATVTAPGDVPVITGTVEYFDGATSLGTAELDALGEATRNVTLATAGTRSVTAAFLGTVDAEASTSAPVSIIVTAPLPPPSSSTTVVAGTPQGTGTGTGPAGQTLTVTPVEELDPNGTEVEVTGTGYDAEAGFDVATEGMYVALCVDQGPGVVPSPCVGGADTTGATHSSSWVTNNPYEGVPEESVTDVAPDGSFQATLTLTAQDEFVDCLDLPAGQRCVVATRMDHRASADRSQDVKVPLCWAGEPACTTEPIPPADPEVRPAFTGYQIAPTGSTRGTTSPRPRLAATGAELGPLPWGIALWVGGAALALGARRARRRSAHLARSLGGPVS